MLGAALLLPVGACTPIADQFSGLFGGGYKQVTLSPRGDRMVRWLQHEGRTAMMAPEPFALMGITNEGRDIPARQMAEDGSDGRYVITLVSFRGVHEFVLHRRQGDTVLLFHHCDTKFTRLGNSVRYPRNGQPAEITDQAFANSDFQQQLAFWFDRMPGR
jgi:hypothetical protein